MRGAWALELAGKVHLIRRPRGPHQGDGGGHQQKQREDSPDGKARMVPRTAPEARHLESSRAWGRCGNGAHMSLALMRGSMTAYSTSTTKLTMTTMAASNITQLRTTIRSRLLIAWKIRRPRPGR